MMISMTNSTWELLDWFQTLETIAAAVARGEAEPSDIESHLADRPNSNVVSMDAFSLALIEQRASESDSE